MSDNQPTPSRFQLPPIVFNGFHLLILLIAIGLTYWVTKTYGQPTQAITETQMAKFQELTTRVTQLEGNVLTQSDLDTHIKQQMGPEFAKIIAKQHGDFTALSVAIGELKGKVEDLGKPKDPGTKTDDGGFKNVRIDQNRNGAPPLTTVRLSYDPKAPLLTGLTGNWENHTERITAKFGEWRTESDGVRSAVTLSREVFDGDTKLGEEKVPLIGGEAFFSKDAIARTAPVPRYTLMFGATFDGNTGQRSLGLLFGKQVTPTWGIATGYVNRGWAVLSTYRFGPK